MYFQVFLPPKLQNLWIIIRFLLRANIKLYMMNNIVETVKVGMPNTNILWTKMKDLISYCTSPCIWSFSRIWEALTKNFLLFFWLLFTLRIQKYLMKPSIKMTIFWAMVNPNCFASFFKYVIPKGDWKLGLCHVSKYWHLHKVSSVDIFRSLMFKVTKK